MFNCPKFISYDPITIKFCGTYCSERNHDLNILITADLAVYWGFASFRSNFEVIEFHLSQVIGYSRMNYIIFRAFSHWLWFVDKKGLSVCLNL